MESLNFYKQDPAFSMSMLHHTTKDLLHGRADCVSKFLPRGACPPKKVMLSLVAKVGRGTEQVKTRQVSLMGISVDTFMGRFVGSP